MGGAIWEPALELVATGHAEAVDLVGLARNVQTEIARLKAEVAAWKSAYTEIRGSGDPRDCDLGARLAKVREESALEISRLKAEAGMYAAQLDASMTKVRHWKKCYELAQAEAMAARALLDDATFQNLTTVTVGLLNAWHAARAANGEE